MAQCVVRTLNQWLPARLRAQRVGGPEDSHMGLSDLEVASSPRGSAHSAYLVGRVV